MENTVVLTKHQLILNNFILKIIFIIAFNGLSAQEIYDHKLNESKWKDIKEGIRYENEKEGKSSDWTYDEDEINQNSQQKNYKGTQPNGSANGFKPSTTTPPSQSNPRLFNPRVLNGLSFVGWGIIGVIAIALILFIVYLIKNYKPNTKINPVEYLDNIAPSDIPLTELQKLLKEAIDTENYREAIRIYYLFILKDLSQKKRISWHKEKTNLHYLREMNNDKLYPDFSIAVNYFEIIWYGKRELNKNQFLAIQPNFTNLLNLLGVN